MFSPGETLIHVFTIPFDPTDIDYVVVSYKKNGEIVLEKKITEDFREHDEGVTSFIVDISQAESLLFSDCGYYTVQINVFSKDKSRNTSKEIRSKNGIQYLKEVMNSE